MPTRKKESPQKCPTCLKYSRIGNTFLKFQKHIKTAVSNCYRATELWLMFSTKSILPVIYKDALSSLQQSHVVYECMCCCRCMVRWLRITKTIEQSQPTCTQIKLACTQKRQVRLQKCKITFPATVTWQINSIHLEILTVLEPTNTINSQGKQMVDLPFIKPPSEQLSSNINNLYFVVKKISLHTATSPLVREFRTIAKCNYFDTR